MKVTTMTKNLSNNKPDSQSRFFFLWGEFSCLKFPEILEKLVLCVMLDTFFSLESIVNLYNFLVALSPCLE